MVCVVCTFEYIDFSFNVDGLVSTFCQLFQITCADNDVLLLLFITLSSGKVCSQDGMYVCCLCMVCHLTRGALDNRLDGYYHPLMTSLNEMALKLLPANLSSFIHFNRPQCGDCSQQDCSVMFHDCR